MKIFVALPLLLIVAFASAPGNCAGAVDYQFCGGRADIIGLCSGNKVCRERFGATFGGFCVSAYKAPQVNETGLARVVITRRIRLLKEDASNLRADIIQFQKDDGKNFKPINTKATKLKKSAKLLMEMLIVLKKSMSNPDLANMNVAFGLTTVRADRLRERVKTAFAGFVTKGFRDDLMASRAMIGTFIGRLTGAENIIAEVTSS